MKLKSVLASTVLCLSMGSIVAMPGLTLCSQGYPNQIDVQCANKSGQPIPPNGCAVAPIIGGSVLPWSGIFAMFHTSSMQCEFTDHVTGQKLAHANLDLNGSIASTQGKISNQAIEPDVTGLSIGGGPFGSMSSNVTATVVKQ